jgi:hypothetical protein
VAGVVRETLLLRILCSISDQHLRRVPAAVGGVDRRLRRRTFLTTELMQNDRLSTLDIGTLTASLEVLFVYLDVHAEDIPLEPIQLLDLLLKKRCSS